MRWVPLVIPAALAIATASGGGGQAPPASRPASGPTTRAGEPPCISGISGISGIYPHLAVFSNGTSECGIGAVVPWADRLWFITYPAHGGDGALYQVDNALTLTRRPQSAGGTHAARMIHAESNQLIIGPYFIDAAGNVRVVKELAAKHRLTAAMRHLTDPAGKVYYQTMEDVLFEVDVKTLAVRQLADVEKALDIVGKAHFKGGFCGQGRVIVANNSYDASDQLTGSGDGRLAEWDGRQWTIIERTAFCDVTDGWTDPAGQAGAASAASATIATEKAIYATGWDKRSVILKVLADGRWSTFRLPKASQCYDHAWCTEWPRIRQIAPGRLMMDFHGMFYEMLPGFRPGRAGGLRPICTHLRMVPDFCTWNGKLILAADDNSFLSNPVGGQPQSNLLFLDPAELGRFGPPAGWGAVWMEDAVSAGKPSDSFLIGGFEKRILHLTQEGAAPVEFALEIDREGDGRWERYQSLKVPSGGYVYRIFPQDLAARWIRLTPSADCKATAMFYFTSSAATADGKGPDPADMTFAGLMRVERYDGEAGWKIARCGGALLPWAGRLWYMPIHAYGGCGSVSGMGLYAVDKDLRPREHTWSAGGVFANRLMLGGQLLIGPHAIGAQGNVRTFENMGFEEIAAAAPHPTAKGLACYLRPDGELLEVDPKALTARPMFDLARELGIKDRKPCFRSLWTSGSTMVVAHAGEDGRLAQWDGKSWTTVARGQFQEIARAGSMSPAILATGADDASAILMVRLDYKWSTYRLPKAPVPAKRWPATDWPRIREVQTERLLMDCGGIFYEMSELLYGGKVWGLRPIAAHGRIIGDFCSFRGLLVLTGVAGDAGEDGHIFRDKDGKDGKVALWLGKTDDLWRLGKPQGVGGPWRKTPIRAGEPSDPYLMTGFDRKTLEISHDGDQPIPFAVEVDILGTGLWKPYARLIVPPGQTLRHELPDGFSAHWARLTGGTDCTATAVFTYE